MVSKVQDADSAEASGREGRATATLVIGNSYTYRGIRFMAGEPRPVSLEMAKELDALTLESTDSRSRKAIAQHRFEVEFPEGYVAEGDDEADEEAEASSGAKRPVRKVKTKPSRSTR